MKFLILLSTFLLSCTSMAVPVKYSDLPSMLSEDLDDLDIMPMVDTSLLRTKKITFGELDERWKQTGDVVGPGSSWLGMMPLYADDTGKLLDTSLVFFEFNDDETNVYFDREDDLQEKGQDVYLNTSEAKDGTDANGGKFSINAGHGKGSGDGGQARIGAGNAPEDGTGGHIELAAGDSDTGNAGDVIATPGISQSNGMGNFVLQDKENDEWISLWGNNGLQFRHDEDRGLRWFDVDNDFVIAILPPVTMGESFHNRWPSSQGNNGDVLTLDDSGTGQMSWQAPGGGGGLACTNFTPSATYSGNLPWSGRYCYSGNQLFIHIEAMATGGGGSGTALEFDLPGSYTIDTSVHPGAGANKFLKVCSGTYGVATSSAYDIMGAPKVGDTTKLAMFYRDNSSSITWNDVANNAPNSQSAGINYVIDCQFTVNE